MARRRIAVVAFPVLFLTLGMASWAAQLSATNDGVTVDAGSQGKFTLTYPEWVAQQDDKRLKPIEKQVAPKRVILNYAGGGTVTVTIQDGQVVMDCKGLPAGVSKFRMDMLIDFGYADGGVWRIGGGKATAFPKTKPAKPFLYQGNARTLELTNSEGKKLTFQIPRYSFQQLQDNREWNWKIFAWMFLTPYDPQVSRYTLTIAEGAAAPGGKPLALVDRFGQDAKLAFPGKVTADSELKQDALRENTEAKAARPDPSRDVYGGLVGSGKTLGLKKTGFFHVQSRGGKWLLVDSDGNAVFHLGVCSFQPAEDYTYTQGRRQIYEWLPPYESEFKTAFHPEKYWSRDTFSFYVANVIRKYGEPYDRERWTTRVIPRVRRWGFNASGAFSGPTAAHQTARFPYVLSLPLSEWQLGRSLPGVRGLLDPFDPKTVAKIDALFAEHLPKRAKDPLLIGYFLANEQAFEDLSRVLPTLKAEQPAKVRLVQWLRDKYATIHAFNQAWGTKEGSFDRLSGMGLPVSTQAAADDLVAFTEVFLTEYFRLIAD
ncbi:hypothetical protein HQ560_01095, partial [bacterium]|nr:hypothetical protein [bacterium]